MKKISILLIVLSIATYSYSQFTKGKFLAGGSVSVSSNSSQVINAATASKSSLVTFNPQVGYFFYNNFGVGMGLDVGHTVFKLPDTPKFTSYSILIEPFARYYFRKLYAQAAFHVGSTRSKTDALNSSLIKAKDSGWSLEVGYAFMVNDRVALEPQVGHRYSYQGYPLDGTHSKFFLKIGIQFYIG